MASVIYRIMRDLSASHSPVSGFLASSPSVSLTPTQLAFFHQHGYLSGIRILSTPQVEILRAELDRLMDPAHPSHSLFYEFHLNESTSASTVLFHALGAWRIEPGFHDLLWHPAFTGSAAQLLG